MDRADRLLATLADGGVHSGAALGSQLGVTRAAVWKLVRQLRSEGAPIAADAGSGYRLETPLEPLDGDAIAACWTATTRAVVAQPWIRRLVDSTNARLFAELDTLSHPVVLLAEAQTAGRGRRGRAWHSPFGRSLYLSVAWPFQDVPGGMSGLSLIAGMAVARILKKHGLTEVALKWPNDLVVGDDKLGGVLVEIQGEPAGPCGAVIGLGLNLDMPDAPGVDQPWTTLRRRLPAWPGRNRLAGEISDALVQGLLRFQESGFAPFLPDWAVFDALSDRPVTLVIGERRVQGIARGVDATGSLLVDSGEGAQPWSAGEVTVRAQR
ncbi:MAG: biotin--[acetyl-CoA-carboxylase] ligase [Ectothiorhodospiraceae bacterium]